jgi:glycosyltransferase involved in cell wall biosynthesis
MLKAKVVVVTRTKDRKLLLGRAIESVLGQRHQDWAHVIINDGGGRDHVEPLVERQRERYAGRVLVLHNEKCLGMEAASNVGLRATSSDYVTIHDDDDTWHPEFLETMVPRLERKQRPTIRGVVSRSLRVVETIEGPELREISRDPFNGALRQLTLYGIAGGNLFPPISFLYERAVHDEIGYFREDFPVLGDWEFNLRFLARWDIDVVRRALANYHHRHKPTEGIYANTISAADDLHALYTSALLNELLRADLEKGRVGIGHLANIAHGQRDVLHTLHGVADQQRQMTTLFSYMKDKIWNAGKRVGLIRD